MRFGIILLLLIAACSVVGSLIQQGQDVSYYAENYGKMHGLILTLGLNDIFTGWYFIALLALLCLNLILCSIVRIKSVVKADKGAIRAALAVPDTVFLNEEGVRKLNEHLTASHCRLDEFAQYKIYSRRRIGRYGTFITHVAILLTVLFGAGALYLPVVTDKPCYPGNAVVMSDGTRISVESFRIEDDEGNLDFTSEIIVKLSNGDTSERTEISVNHPFSFGSYKVYQQTYGTAGSVTVRDNDTGATDDFILDEVSFLSADGVNGLWFEALYPGYIEDEDGTMTLITSTSGSYSDPIYQVVLTVDSELTPVLAFPGESLRVGNLEFIFNDPIEYPGLRIKYTPGLVNGLLCAAFLLMTVGLYISFFMPPVLVKTDAEGYTVLGPKPEYTRLELKALLEKYEEDRVK